MSKKPSSLSGITSAQGHTYNPSLKNLIKNVESSPQHTEGNLVRMNFEIEEDLRNEFKAKVAKQGKRVKDVFSAFMREYINNDN
jgi:chorismate mutase